MSGNGRRKVVVDGLRCPESEEFQDGLVSRQDVAKWRTHFAQQLATLHWYDVALMLALLTSDLYHLTFNSSQKCRIDPKNSPRLRKEQLMTPKHHEDVRRRV